MHISSSAESIKKKKKTYEQSRFAYFPYDKVFRYCGGKSILNSKYLLDSIILQFLWQISCHLGNYTLGSRKKN